MSDELTSKIVHIAPSLVMHEALSTECARHTFLSALANPPHPNERLVALADRYVREVKSRP